MPQRTIIILLCICSIASAGSGILLHLAALNAISLISVGIILYLHLRPPAASRQVFTHEESRPDTAAPASDLTVFKDKLQIIPVLTGQLKAVIDQTDEAANDLSAAFMGISRQAKRQFQMVEELLVSLTQNNSGSATIADTEENLGKIQLNFSTITSFLDSLTEQMATVADHLVNVELFAGKIAKIGKTTSILALNAAIEAAGAGTSGAGFSVIATEVKSLSENSNKSITEISQITTQLSDKIREIKTAIENARLQSHQIVITTNQLFAQATSSLKTLIADTTNRIGVLNTDASQLSKEISRAVVSIQFQDITRQRIEHVMEPLEQFRTDFITALQQTGQVQSSAGSDASVAGLLSNYTMESERTLLRQVTTATRQ